MSARLGWGIPASILLHAVLVFALFFPMPVDPSEAQKEESVSVEIVPPPDEPQEKAEDQKQPAAPKIEEAKKEEPKEEAKKEETPPPEPPKQEEAKSEAPPPPPPPAEPPKEEAKPLPPPAPQPDQPQAKQEPPPANEQAREQPLPVLNPVFQFGEKDAGPRQSKAGNSAQEASPPPADAKPDVAEAEPAKPASDEPQAVTDAPKASPVPDDINVPEIAIASASPLRTGPSEAPAPDAMRMEIVPPPTANTETPAAKAPAEKPSELKEAKTLFSRSATRDAMATVAMAGMPRGTRAGALCATELGSQLSAMSYSADLVPRLPLPQGTVLNGRNIGFRAGGQWYDVSFRCEIDESATKVLSFALNVGPSIPRSEWRKRGFPEY